MAPYGDPMTAMAIAQVRDLIDCLLEDAINICAHPYGNYVRRLGDTRATVCWRLVGRCLGCVWAVDVYSLYRAYGSNRLKGFTAGRIHFSMFFEFCSW